MPNFMLFMGQIWVPKTAKNEIMKKLHLSHMGKTKLLVPARDLYYWPGMVKAIKKLVWACPECKRYQISEPANPYLQTLDAAYPWQQLTLFQARSGMMLSGGHESI